MEFESGMSSLEKAPVAVEKIGHCHPFSLQGFLAHLPRHTADFTPLVRTVNSHSERCIPRLSNGPTFIANYTDFSWTIQTIYIGLYVSSFR